MIAKGAGRTNGKQLGAYLSDYLESEKNKRVEVLELRGTVFSSLTDAIASWEAEAKATKCKKPLWHAQLRGPAGESLTREQQIECADIMEKYLGFEGQPRAIVMHENDNGDQHIHVVWSRIDRETGKARRDSFTHKKNVEAAREIEQRFGLQHVESPTFDKTKDRRTRREESKKAADRGDYQKAKRTGLDPVARKKEITALWNQSDSGKAFRTGLEDAGYILAYGDKRDYVVFDKAGDIHSLARQIKGALAKDVRQRLADIDAASVPQVEHVRSQLWRSFQENRKALNSDQLDRERPMAAMAILRTIPQSAPSRPPPIEAKRDPQSLLPADLLADMTARNSTFTKGDLSFEIGKRLKAKTESESADAKEVDRVTATVVGHNDCIPLGLDKFVRERFTSRDMLKTELDMRDASDILFKRWFHGVRTEVKGAAPSAAKLGEEQKKAFEHVTNAEALSIVIGYAGGGKSTMLGAAREAWEAQGYRVRGLAVAGIAASSLQQGSKIESSTLASFFYHSDKLAEQQAKIAAMDERIAQIGKVTLNERRLRSEMQSERDRYLARIDKNQLGKRDVVVLDEAGMVGSKQMGRLLEMAKEAGAKVVLVGDAEQLQAIDAGGAFRALADRHGAVKISEIRRQTADWQKRASKDFGDGFTAEALRTYKDRSHLHEHAGHAEAREQVISAWKDSRKSNPNESHLMMAFTRNDVAELNKAGREAYKSEGRLGLDEAVNTESGRKNFATGDRMYFLENRRLSLVDSNGAIQKESHKVTNGTLGTVEKIESNTLRDYHSMTVRLDSGERVSFRTDEYAKFSHGYASTITKSQGTTVARSFVLASQFMDRHGAYVSMTRHTDQVDMHYAKAEFKNFDGLVRTLSRDRRKDTTLDYLRRAEAKGKGDSIRNLLKDVIRIVTKEDARKQAVERMLAALKIERDPAERARKLEAAEKARRLRDVLGERPDRKRNRDFGRSM